jgi:hypothetical protein
LLGVCICHDVSISFALSPGERSRTQRSACNFAR